MDFFDVRKGEGRPVILFLLMSFFVGIPRVFTLAAANDLFISEHGPANLPWAYSAGAPVLAIMGLVYVRLGKRVSARALGIGALVVLALTNAVAYLSLGLLGPGLTSFWLIIGVEAEFTLTALVFWNAAYRVFSIPQARRLFGLISSGEVVPLIAGGLALPWLVDELGVWNLLLISVAGHLLAIIALTRIEHMLDNLPIEEDTTPTGARAETQDAQRKYLIWIGVMVGLNVFVYYAVDNAFYHSAQVAFPVAGSLAAFLGNFLVALGLANLGFKIFLSGRWRAWLGLRAVLLSVPATLIVLGAIVLIAHGSWHTASGALFAVVLFKLWERVSVEAIHVPAYHALLLPLPTETRRAAQGTLEGIVAHGATLIGGGLLVALNQQLELGARGLAVVALVALVLWVAAVMRVCEGYSEVLRTALAERRLDTSGLRVADATTLQLLQEQLRSPDASEVLWNLHLLRELRDPKIESLAAQLLTHSDEMVVEAAARMLEKDGTPNSVPLIIARLQSQAPASGRTQARLLRALSATAADGGRDVLIARLQHDSPEVIAAAVVGLLRHGDPGDSRIASPRLTVLCRASEARTRKLAARALGSIRDPALARMLTRLLRDPDLAVRRAAIQAAGRMSADGLWPFVIDALSERRLRDDAAQALVLGGTAALPHVLEAVARPNQYWRVQYRLLDIAARIGGPTALEAIKAAITQPDLSLRRAALVALERTDTVVAASERGFFEALVTPELEVHAYLTKIHGGVAHWSEGDLLREALQRELQKSQDRLLISLCMAFPGENLREARSFAANANAETRNLAMELLEQSLPVAILEQVRPLLSPAAEIAGSGLKGDAPRHLAGLPEKAKAWGLRWLATCAIDAAQTADLRLATADLTDAPKMLARVQALLRIDILRGLSGEQLSDLALRATERQLPPGTPLVLAGQDAQALYILQRGMLSMAIADKRPALFSASFATESLALLRPLASECTITAESDAEVLEVRAEHLQDLIDDDFDAAWRILEGICQRMRHKQKADLPTNTTPVPPASHGRAKARSYYDVLQRLLSLRSSTPFRNVDEDILLAIAEAADEVTFTAQQIIVARGDVGTSMFILLEGQVRVHNGDEDLATIQAPNIFGELSAIAPAPRSASITAVTASRALILSRATLYNLALAQHDVLGVMRDLILDRMNVGLSSSAGPIARPSFLTDDLTL